MEGNNLNNMNVENNNENNIQPSVVNNQPPVIQSTPQVPIAPTVVEPTPIIQPTTENITTNTILENNSNNGKKKSPLLFIILGIALVAIIGVVIFFVLTGKDKEENKDSGKEPNKQNQTVEVNWNGVYENGENYIYIYQLNDDELEYNAYIDENSFSGTADIDGNTAEGDIFETYTFVLNGDSLEFTTTDEDITNGTFKKVKDYTQDDYYKDNIGDPTYLETGLNGVFENNGITITIYQINEEEAVLKITKEFSLYQRNVEIVDGKIISEDNFLGDDEIINASIDEEILTITASSTAQDSLLNEISGTYTRTETLTVEDIINL